MLRILVAMLMLVSGQAKAEWVLLGENDGARYYTNPTKLRSAEYMVKMWVLFDHKTVKLERGKPYLSTRAQEEFDCKGERWRILSYSLHDGPMGDGNPVYVSPMSPVRDWKLVSPESMVEAFWNFACGKK